MQDIVKYNWDSDLKTFSKFAEARKVENTSFDIYKRVLESVITNYTDITKAAVRDVQKVHTLSGDYDMFGNAKKQIVDTYDNVNTLIDSKVIVNTYTDPIAQRRGNATTSTVTRYSTLARAVSDTIDEVVTESVFDEKGNAKTQLVKTSVYDGTSLKQTPNRSSATSTSAPEETPLARR